ncbi:MAG: hypothetical protein JKX76_14855 [Colwellia sp.]|nr:hypothetical protein [Colwellia sp.]
MLNISMLKQKKVLLSLAIVFLVMLSWQGVLDDYADEYTNHSIIGAGSVYAVARGINALVSVLQTTTVGVGIGLQGSVAIGELLDPVNDLIERFSQVMTVALGSLVLQKVLLNIVSQTFFNIIISMFGLVALITLWTHQSEKWNVVFRLFLMIVFVRFSLGLAVAMNSVVDVAFIEKDITKNATQLSAFKNELSVLQNNQEGVAVNNSDEQLGLISRALNRAFNIVESVKKGFDAAKIERMVQNTVNHIMYLVVLFILQSILIPLGFFYAVLHGIKWLWRLNWQSLS